MYNDEDTNIQIIKDIVARNGMRPNNDPGKLGEQFTECIFDPYIKGNKETNEASLDFTIDLSGRKFILETKVLTDIYVELYEIFYKVCADINKKELCLGYTISADPFNIHKEDRIIFEGALKEFLQNFDDAKLSMTFEIKAKTKTYLIKVDKPYTWAKNFGTSFSGPYNKQTSNLRNTIHANKEQLMKSDILFLIILNELVNKEEMLKEFYQKRAIQISSEDSDVISQYVYENTIWSKTKNNLKCVIAIYPKDKKVIVYPSLFHHDDFSANTYTTINEILKSKDLNVEFITSIHTI